MRYTHAHDSATRKCNYVLNYEGIVRFRNNNRRTSFATLWFWKGLREGFKALVISEVETDYDLFSG